MGCCPIIQSYYAIQNLSLMSEIPLNENEAVTSMLLLQDSRLFCGMLDGTIHVYKINQQGSFDSINSPENQHNKQIISLCNLNNDYILSASIDKLLIWKVSSNVLSVVTEYPIEFDIDKVIGLNGKESRFAVGYLKENENTISIYEYNPTSSPQQPIKSLNEEQEDGESTICSMIHLENGSLVSSCKSDSEGHLTFWNIDTQIIQKNIRNLCTHSSNGLTEFRSNRLIVASSDGDFVLLNLNTYVIETRISNGGKMMFDPVMISLSVFKEEYLLYASNGNFGQLLIRFDEHRLLFKHEGKGKCLGKGLILTPNEKYVIVDNDSEDENTGSISILRLEYLKIEQ